MADFALLLEAPSRGWAEHVESLMKRGLGDKGSVQLNLPGEPIPGSVSNDGYFVSGMAVCDEPENEMLELITAQLVDYDVEIDDKALAVPRITVRPTVR